MEQKKRVRHQWYIWAGFGSVWICMVLYVLPHTYGPVILPDEFGYWAQAASMAGMDWKEVMSLHSWYSPGYGLLMLPFLKLIKDPVLLYRCMVTVNFLLLAAAAGLLYQIINRILPQMGRALSAFISGAAMLYVAYITYAQTTMAETLLVFLYVLLAYGMVRWTDHPGIRSGLFVMLICGMMYLVHLRTVGIMLATVLCMLAAELLREKSRRKLWYTLGLLILTGMILAAAGYIKEYIVSGVASQQYQNLVSANDYSGQWGKLKLLFSLEGIYRFLTGLAGKVFYLGCASFGLYYWGMAFLLRKLKTFLETLRGKKPFPQYQWLYLWLLLSHVAAVMITNIYCLSSSRLDGVLYGRYHENTIPVIMALGTAQLLLHPEFKRRALWLLGILSGSFFVIYFLLGSGEILYTNRHSITGILYALKIAENYDTQILLYAYLAGGLGGVAVLAALWFTGGGKRRRFLLVTICVLQLGLSIYAGNNLTLSAGRAQREDAEKLCLVKEMLDGRKDAKAVYLYREKSRRIYLVQYILQEFPLHLMTEEEISGCGQEDFIVMPVGEQAAETICLRYANVLETPHYWIYYNTP
ncbi:MAG: hypothetical protein HDR26_04825 [Lachnospiraceae bacterium]|nr:hypothetical protein [Lachnospiraceae bacterium]